MSQPKRYALRMPDISYGTEESPTGKYVYYEDYARLKADIENCHIAIRVKQDEMARFKADLEKSDFAVWTLSNENARLKAEVERLTEAVKFNFHGGDRLLADISRLLTAHRKYCDINAIDYRQMEKDALNAAKEGKGQP